MNTTATASSEFTIRQTTALHALASGFSVTEAAEAAGVHRSQVYRWLDNPKYNHAFLNAKREHALAIGYRFHTLAHKALDALEQILTDEKTNPHARIRAAKVIFEKMHYHQPRLKPSMEEMLEINDQCKDAKAPHIVVGRFPYDPEICEPYQAQPQPETEPATERDPIPELTKAAAATASATECDTKTKVPRQGEPKAVYPATECDATETVITKPVSNVTVTRADAAESHSVSAKRCG